MQLTFRAAGKTTVFAVGLTDNTAMPLDTFGFEKNHLYVKPLAVLPPTGQVAIPYLRAKRGRFLTAWFGGLAMELVVEIDEAGK